MWVVCYDENGLRVNVYTHPKFYRVVEWYKRNKRKYRIEKDIKLYIYEVENG